MATIQTSSIVNDRTLNIFTDASISKYPGTNIVTGGAGAEYYIGDRFLYSDLRILFNTTNNQSELMSILLGVLGAVQNRYMVDTINLFSDSKISVYGLREWVFSWAHNIHDGVMYNSSGQPVANQKLVLNIIDAITRNSLNINIFHIRGHMDCNKEKDILECKRSFIKENHLHSNTKIELPFIQFLVAGNSSVDNYTRNKLYDVEYMNLVYSNQFINTQAINIDPSFYLRSIDFRKYKELIGV